MTKYTYKDWLEGRINNNDVTAYTLQHAVNIDCGYNEPHMIDEETKKIKEAWKWAFWTAIDITFQDWLNDFEWDYQESPYPQQFLDDLVSTLEKDFKGFKKSVRSIVLKGKPNYKGIDGRSYLLVKEANKKFNETGQSKRIGFAEWNVKAQKWQKNEVYEATLIWKQLRELNTRINKISTKQPKPNEFRKGLEKLAKENEPDRKQFVSDAKEFLSKKTKAGKPRSDYISGKGWPTVKFFKDPFRKSKIPESTRKDWIKKAVDTGEI